MSQCPERAEAKFATLLHCCSLPESPCWLAFTFPPQDWQPTSRIFSMLTWYGSYVEKGVLLDWSPHPPMPPFTKPFLVRCCQLGEGAEKTGKWLLNKPTPVLSLSTAVCANDLRIFAQAACVGRRRHLTILARREVSRMEVPVFVPLAFSALKGLWRQLASWAQTKVAFIAEELPI